MGNDAGQLAVIATEGDGTCGISVLSLTQNTMDDWNIGNARYNDGVSLHLGRPAGFGGERPRHETAATTGAWGEGSTATSRESSTATSPGSTVASAAGAPGAAAAHCGRGQLLRDGRRHRLYELPRPDRDQRSLQDGLSYSGANRGLQ